MPFFGPRPFARPLAWLRLLLRRRSSEETLACLKKAEQDRTGRPPSYARKRTGKEEKAKPAQLAEPSVVDKGEGRSLRERKGVFSDNPSACLSASLATSIMGRTSNPKGRRALAAEPSSKQATNPNFVNFDLCLALPSNSPLLVCPFA